MNQTNKIFNKMMAVMVLIVFLYSGVFTISSFYELNKNIKQYDYQSHKIGREMSYKDKCKIFECTAIRNGNEITYFDKYTPMKDSTVYSKYYHIYDRLYYDNTLIQFSFKTNTKTFVYFDIAPDHDKHLAIIILTLPMILLIFIYIVSSTIKTEREESIITLASSEALLANKSMINITENIHHELNTPLEVIDNKIEKIRRALKGYLIEEGYNTCDISGQPKEKSSDIIRLEEDFDFIKSSSEQIYAVLEKMKGFKHLRYSNGNKSVKNIIDGGFKIINISNTNFEFKVDKNLSRFKINSTSLKNADLLSIILNHIKNSLEANASKIYIIMVSNKDGILKFRIIDNGNGIPRKAQGDIFKANFSTKSEDGGIRGNGMYLNKHIIKTSGGDIDLVSSSNKGTTIELSIPTKEK